MGLMIKLPEQVNDDKAGSLDEGGFLSNPFYAGGMARAQVGPAKK